MKEPSSFCLCFFHWLVAVVVVVVVNLLSLSLSLSLLLLLLLAIVGLICFSSSNSNGVNNHTTFQWSGLTLNGLPNTSGLVATAMASVVAGMTHVVVSVIWRCCLFLCSLLFVVVSRFVRVVLSPAV